jgi:diaminopimelate epimerase
MLHTIQFTKASGAGNDFVLVDNMRNEIAFDKAKLARAVCSRYFGVGADGLILLEPSSRSDFFMRYYNADGSYGGMCGNGGRCVARYAFLKGVARAKMKFEALDHVYTAEVVGAEVKLSMKDPSEIRSNVQIPVDGQALVGHTINTGSPHVVLFEDAIESADVTGLGRKIRHHAMFLPEGTNVDFVGISSEGILRIRTYERGVEAETLACGTGAVASAIIASLEKGAASPVRLRVQSGEELRVSFESRGSSIRDVVLEGSAYVLFTGTLTYDDATDAMRDILQPHGIPHHSRTD